MSQDQLVEAYLEGQMSRRTFVRRLAAGGATVSAAFAYAHLLRPQAAKARLLRDLHGETLTAKMVVQDLDRVMRNRYVKVRVTSTGAQSWPLYLHMYRSPAKTSYPDVVIGNGGVSFDGPGTQVIQIPFGDHPIQSPNAIQVLNEKRRVKLGVSTYDGNDPNPLASAIYSR